MTCTTDRKPFFMIQRLFVMSIILLQTMSVTAQDLSDYRWINRVLVIITDSPESNVYIEQIKELGKDLKGLKERKLLVLSATKNAYKEGIDMNADWKDSITLYQKFEKSNTGFDVILIGLDGGVKARRQQLLKLDDLFTLIDGMPMRRAEIKNDRP